MKIVISLLNVSVYLIPLFKFLSHKLKLKDYLILFLIYFINVGFIIDYFGNFSVVFLMLLAGGYLSCIQKNIRIKQKLCILLISYLFCVVWDNIFAFILGILGINILKWIQIDKYYIIYMLIYLILLYIVTYFAYRAIKCISKKFIVVDFTDSIWDSIMLNLIICFVIFYCNIIIGEYIGYSKNIIAFNCVLFICYFTVLCILSFNIVKAYKKVAEIKIKENSYDILQKYTTEIENMYSNIRSFKHDYQNIMLSISGYINENDFDGLKRYFEKDVIPLTNQITNSNYKISSLMYIKIPAIKSIVSSKLIYAHEIGCNISVEILEPIDKISMDNIDLSRVLGIFLDNAIESAQECSDPKINLVMIKMHFSIVIILMNNFIEHEISYHSLNRIYVSSKGENRGIGLYNAKNILDKYQNILHETKIEHNNFMQRLEILTDNQ